MIIFGTCVGGSGERYENISLPSIQRVASMQDLILSLPGDDGICQAYNRFIDEARNQPECQALVLLHDDLEIIDANFRPKVLASLRDDNVGVTGVVGGAGLKSLDWWRARRTAGRVFETRGLMDLGDRRAEVDVVDGLLMVLSPTAFSKISFDAGTFPNFHGYDVDYCLQVKAEGLRVGVFPIDVLHRTKGAYGDRADFDHADRALRRKWPEFLQAPSRVETVRDLNERVVKARYLQARRAVGRVQRLRAQRAPVLASRQFENAPPDAPERQGVSASDRNPTCPVCDCVALPATSAAEEEPAILKCVSCGLGITWPSPGRNVEGDGLWVEMYGNARIAQRDIWDREALLRVSWMQLYAPEGCIVEVGCGTGEFVKAARDSGYEAYGVEVSEWAAARARELGVDVKTGYFQDWVADFPGYRLDAIAMWHVLEHVPEPLELLRQLARALKPGGVLVLEVPNFDSSDAQWLGLNWDGAQVKDHVFHYHPAALRSLLQRAGFEIRDVLPISRRIYSSPASWRSEHNQALLERRPWPALDYLRAVAIMPGSER